MKFLPHLRSQFTFALLALLLPVRSAVAAPVTPGFTETVFTSGLRYPVAMAWAPDSSGRLFVTEKEGGIRVIANGTLLATPFAIFPQLYTQSECGVLGICFDPNYTINRYVYVFVTISASEQRIVRFTDVNNQGTARTNIVSNLPTLGVNHNGGALAFGNDGKLYWAIGDTGQKRGVDGDLASLAAKVGRANADGSVPADNPFNDGSGPNNDYIWATGFRNPFTMTFQRSTGKLWLNVVGSNPGGQTDPGSGPGYEQVFVLNAGDDGGYDDFEGNQPDGSRYNTPFVRPFSRPVLQYKTSNSDESAYQRNTATFSRSSGITVVTTSSAHPYRVGQAVKITGASSATFNRTFCVRSVPSPTTFTAFDDAADGSATGGTVRPVVIGSSIGGGEFYESTAFPADYRGNFFFCDYTGGNVTRATFTAQNRLRDLRSFSTGLSSPVDVAVGPDGALYVAELGSGTIRRIAWSQPATDIIVSPTTFNMSEGGRAKFNVQLATAPTGNVTVEVHRTSPDTDTSVILGNVLNFDATNWNIARQVVLGAAPDTDTVDDRATFAVSATGLRTEMVNVIVTDNSANAPLVTTGSIAITEGQAGGFYVSLPQRPAKSVTVAVRRISGPDSVSVSHNAAIVFTPENFSRQRRVNIFAAEDDDNLDTNAAFSVGAAGFTSRTVSVRVMDNDPSASVFTTTPRTRTVVGLPYRYATGAAARPAPIFRLLAAPPGMTIDPGTGLVEWTPQATGDFAVKISARNGIAPTRTQSFTLTVVADQPPSVFLTAPANGATISGANAEFFGSAGDDYGCYKAEFYVDDVLRSTDTNREDHYHFNGSHQRFDTTAFSNGTHTLKMIVYDDKNQTATATVQVVIAN